WLPDGNHLLITIQKTNLNNMIYILNIETGKLEVLGKEGEVASYGSVMLTDDGKYAYLLTDYHAETTYIARLALDSPQAVESIYHVEKWDIEGLQLSPDEKTLIFTVNDGGRSRLLTMDTSTHEVNQIQSVPDGVISSLSWLDASKCIFTLKTPVDPGDIWQVTITDGKLRRLTNIGKSVDRVPLYEPE